MRDSRKTQLSIPYGSGFETVLVDKARTIVTLAPGHTKAPGEGQSTKTKTEASSQEAELSILKSALESPSGALRLRELARGKSQVVILTSDHTRPVPSRLTLPLMLHEIREGNPKANITIIIGVGCHRGTTIKEMEEKFGKELCARERILNHDPHDQENLVSMGVLPSGGELILNRMAVEADLLVADGFIEPHQFAGFSGGPKSVLPGIASFKTVLFSHNAEFTVHPKARPGSLAGNPFRADMLHAARVAKLAFILNVTLTEDKRISGAFAGDLEEAHNQGCDFVLSQSAVKGVISPIVITSNGGYPLDQNIYQSTKSIMQADLICEDGGVIIAVNECRDGHGSLSFLESFKNAPSLKDLLSDIESRSKDETIPDQWVIQLTASILLRRRVIMVTKANVEEVEALGMRKAESLEEALKMADELSGNPLAPISVLPNAVAVVIRP
ncbi:MAG: nickel-dependent lactate racemase [Deltaproteobacteria bacterium]|jgi:nickel-dependent lactate racemase|nr:nickel-dependent lactate racemase [Deltaproteobacteria bacterium]